MKPRKLFLGLVLLLLFSLGSVAQAGFLASEENGKGLDLRLSDLYIENIVYHDGKILAQENAMLYEVQEDGSFIFLADLPITPGKSGKILLDEGKVLYFNEESFYYLELGDTPSIKPAYEGIFIPKDSIVRVLANQKQIIYLCYAMGGTGEYTVQYYVDKASNNVQKESNRYLDAIQGLYKDEGLFAYFSFFDDYLGEDAGIYLLKNKDLQRLPYGEKDKETLSKISLRYMLYHPEMDAFFGISDSYLYRISRDTIEKVAINLNYDATPFLIDEQGNIRMPSPKGYVRIPKDATLDTSNILTVYTFYDPELFYAYHELGKDYQIALAEEGYEKADILFENYNTLKNFGSYLPKPLDLQEDSVLEAEFSKMYPYIQNRLQEGEALRYVPMNVYYYNSPYPFLNLLYHEKRLQELLPEGTALPQTYEEFADFILQHLSPTDPSISLFPYTNPDDTLERLMFHFLYQYQMDCERTGQAPDKNYAKSVLEKLQKLKAYSNHEQQNYQSLVRPMEDLLLYPEGWKPLPLQAVENSPYGIQAEMDILFVNENCKHPEAAREFLHFVLEHLPLKNKAKIYKDYILPPEGESHPGLKKTTENIVELKQVQEALSKGQIHIPTEDAIALQKEIYSELSDYSSLYSSLNQEDLTAYQALADKIYINIILREEPDFDEIISDFFPEED